MQEKKSVSVGNAVRYGNDAHPSLARYENYSQSKDYAGRPMAHTPVLHTCDKNLRGSVAMLVVSNEYIICL